MNCEWQAALETSKPTPSDTLPPATPPKPSQTVPPTRDQIFKCWRPSGTSQSNHPKGLLRAEPKARDQPPLPLNKASTVFQVEPPELETGCGGDRQEGILYLKNAVCSSSSWKGGLFVHFSAGAFAWF